MSDVGTARESPLAPKQRCEAQGCRGARLQGPHCLEHLDRAEFHVAVERFARGDPIDARATTVTAGRLQELLQALEGDAGRPVLPAADFSLATFSEDADFAGTSFSGRSSFLMATFSGNADFDAVTFDEHVGFTKAKFCGDAAFRDASFRDSAGFDEATFGAAADFDAANFGDVTNFSGTRFGADAYFRVAKFCGDVASFGEATFSDGAIFGGANFSGGAGFGRATFSGDADFEDTRFGGSAHFGGATFERARQFGPIVAEAVVLDGCVFSEQAGIEIAAVMFSCRGASFAGGVHVRARWAEIAIDQAHFARPSSLSGVPAWEDTSDLGPLCAADDRRVELQPQPRLITVRGAHVVDLSLAGIDLRACRFFAARGLEAVSIDASCIWPRSQTRLLQRPRETIAEEHHWRGDRWSEASTRPPRWLEHRDGPEQLTPPQIAGLYRALRKAREEGKDEPGAADLYHGEMEMRRRTKGPAGQRVRGASDRAIITAYWLLSGYGLKASRAFAWLLALIAAGSLGLDSCGFTPDASYTRGLLYSIESTSSLFRQPTAPGLSITYTGESIQIALRILGPLLIGLGLIALRARVKR